MPTFHRLTIRAPTRRNLSLLSLSLSLSLSLICLSRSRVLFISFLDRLLCFIVCVYNSHVRYLYLLLSLSLPHSSKLIATIICAACGCQWFDDLVGFEKRATTALSVLFPLWVGVLA